MVSNWQIQQAARVVRHGGVIAYPTEAVWGLGCDPWNDEAVERLLALKERPVHKGLILNSSTFSSTICRKSGWRAWREAGPVLIPGWCPIRIACPSGSAASTAVWPCASVITRKCVRCAV
jgi:hypothetical protein